MPTLQIHRHREVVRRAGEGVTGVGVLNAEAFQAQAEAQRNRIVVVQTRGSGSAFFCGVSC